MTPLLVFLERYFAPRAALVILCGLYALVIVACCLFIGRLSPEPILYLDIR